MPHVKGEWARKRMTLKLEPWQKFILSTLFGWKRAKDGLRRFREAYIEVPRKNGKSCFVAPMGLYMLVADGEEGAEVYSGATTEKQAWEVYGPARIMAKRAEGFMEHYGVDVRAKNMNLIGSASRFEPLIGDPGDGASPHCAIVDEYHEHDSPRLYDTMITGMGARRQPLIIVITTAGFNLGGPCYDMRLRAGKVLDRTLQDEELFAIVYTIRGRLEEPRGTAEGEPEFRCFRHGRLPAGAAVEGHPEPLEAEHVQDQAPERVVQRPRRRLQHDELGEVRRSRPVAGTLRRETLFHGP